MEDLCETMPLIGQILLNTLDNQSLTNCKTVTRKLDKFLGNERFYWIRVIKQYEENFSSFSDSWKMVIQKTPTEIIKEIGINSEQFFLF